MKIQSKQKAIRLILIILSCTLLVWLTLLFRDNPSASGDTSKLVAVYQEYNGTWYEFRATDRLPLHDWDSLDQLKAFIAYDDTDQRIFLKANSNGLVNFNGRCEEYARKLRNRAESFGMRLETEDTVSRENYKRHMINKAFIGNEVYYIEPSEDRIWFVGNLE